MKLGFIQGDGQTNRMNSKHHKGIEVNIGYKDDELLDLFEVIKLPREPKYYISGIKDMLLEYGFEGKILPERVFPTKYNEFSKEEKSNFLKGCYSANGCVIKKHRVAYKTTCYKLAQQIKETLNNDFNITANITMNKATRVKFRNGEYLCKQSYDINLNKLDDIIIFYQNIGFVQKYKMIDLIDLIKIKSPIVMTIKNIGKENVYDFSEPITHWGVVENIIVHNCGEEPLPSGGSCLLGSINLSEFVECGQVFNENDFVKTVEDCVIALNEVLDEGISLHPLQQQRDSVSDWRQIGLGIMGLGDMLVKAKQKYGNPESIRICDAIGFLFIDTAIASSARLAKQYGCYPKYNKQAIFKSEFFIKNTSKETKKLVEKYGLRNSQLLTTAPTGTLSSMLGISGGIEPIYSFSYTRKTESLHGEDKSYKIYTPIVKKYMEENKITDENKLPEYFINAMNLDYINRINMQGIWQSHIDASISSTVNVPQEFTVEDVKKLYMYAWESGIKGITIYRDNCSREGILTTTTKPKIKYQNIDASDLPRGYIEDVPEQLNYRKYKLKTGCGVLYFFVGIDECEGKIYDVFCNTDGESGCVINTQSVSRLLSAGIRGGIPVEYLVKQMGKAGICPSYQFHRGKGEKLSSGKSCSSSIANVIMSILKEFDEYDTEVIKLKIQNPCPSCGEELRFESGCKNCVCGYSKCD